jgi:hypothetical protein
LTGRAARYAVVVALMAVPLAWAGFGVGHSVRAVLDDVRLVSAASWVYVRLDAPTTLYVRNDASAATQPPCQLREGGGSARLAPPETNETVDFGSTRWLPAATVTPVRAGTVELWCPDVASGVDWALGPTPEEARNRIGGAVSRATWLVVVTLLGGAASAVWAGRGGQRHGDGPSSR